MVRVIRPSCAAARRNRSAPSKPICAAISASNRRVPPPSSLPTTSTAEAWIALRFLGHPLAIWDVLALESIIYAIRSAVFFVPAGLGFQEGGYVMVCAALGLPPEVALAVSLLKRGREVLLGVPALLAWHFLDDAR